MSRKTKTGSSANRAPNRFNRKRSCPFKAAGIKNIDYKNVNMLSQFITDRGKIIPRRISGVSAYYQKMLSNAVKRARYMALLPFVSMD